MLLKAINNFSEKQFFIISILLIIFLTIIVYGNSIYNEFTNWDDNALVVYNSSIRSLNLENIKNIFTFHKGSTYQPIRVLSYAIDYHFWRLNPLGYHLHSIILHCVATIFLYLSVVQILIYINIATYHNQRFLALLTSILFLVHPINVEAVTWLSSRKYVLLSCFSFISFYLFIKSYEKESMWMIAISFIFSCLAVFSSPFGIALPFLFFLFDYSRDTLFNPFKILHKRLKNYFLFILLFCFSSPVLWKALAGAGGGAQTRHYQNNVIYTIYTMFSCLFDYGRNFIFPFGLNNRYVDYLFLTPIDIYKIPIAVFVFIITILWIFFKLKQGKRFCFFCILWFLIMWSPASNIIPISTKMADRYVYMASPGIFLLISYFLIKLYSIIVQINHKFVFYIVLFSFFLCFVAPVSLFSILAIQRNIVWKNSGTLWEDSLIKDYNNYLAHNNLGQYLFECGESEKAFFHFKQSLRLNPRALKTLENMAYSLTKLNRLDEAYTNYKKLIDMNPNNSGAYVMISSILVKQNKINQAYLYIDKILNYKPEEPPLLNTMGNIFIAIGQIDRAVSHYKEAVKKFPYNPDLYFNLGLALYKQDSLTDSIYFYNKAIDISPDHVDALNGLGLVKEAQGDLEEAYEYYKKALRIDDSLAQAHNNIGNILIAKKETKEAISHYQQAVKLDADYLDAHYNLGIALSSMGSLDEACLQYKKILKKDPSYIKAANNLGNVLIKQNKFKEAINCFKEAIKINNKNPDLLYNIAVAFEFIGDKDSAINSYKKLIEIVPDDAEVYNKLGMLIAGQKKIEEAIDYFKAAIAIKSNYTQPYFNLGIIFMQKRDFDHAVYYLKKAKDFDPDNKELLYILSQIVKQ